MNSEYKAPMETILSEDKKPKCNAAEVPKVAEKPVGILPRVRSGDEQEESMAEIAGRVFATELVEDMRQCLYNEYCNNDIVMNTLEMISVNMAASGKDPTKIAKHGFIEAYQEANMDEVLFYLIYFMAQGHLGRPMEPYDDDDILR